MLTRWKWLVLLSYDPNFTPNTIETWRYHFFIEIVKITIITFLSFFDKSSGKSGMVSRSIVFGTSIIILLQGWHQFVRMALSIASICVSFMHPAVMAPDGQWAAQVPQPVQMAGSIQEV